MKPGCVYGVCVYSVFKFVMDVQIIMMLTCLARITLTVLVKRFSMLTLMDVVSLDGCI